MRSGRRTRFTEGGTAIAFAVVAVLFWYYRLIVPATGSAPVSDIMTQIYPMAYRASDWMREGHIPLWNPFQLCGKPFLASVGYGIFYPLNFPYLLFPTAVALEVIAVLHIFLAGVFTYIYARAIGMTRPGAAVAGTTYMLSGFVASQALWLTPAIAALVWLPIGLLAVDRLFATSGPTGVILLAVAVAMPILAGYMQTWMNSMYAIIGYTGGRLCVAGFSTRCRSGLWKVSVRWGAGIALGLMLTAIQLLPSIELQGLGPRRPGGLTLQQTLIMGPMLPAALLHTAANSVPSLPRYMYVGMLPLLLIPLSLFAASKRRTVFLMWFLGAFGIVIALTVFTPVFRLYRLLPAATWFRAPWRILIVYAFAAAVLSGVGFDVAMQAGAGGTPRRRLAVAAMVITAALGWLWLVDMPALSRAYLCAGALLLVGAAGLRWRHAFRISLVALLGLLVCDLFFASRSHDMHPFHDLTAYDGEREALDFIRDNQGYYRTYIYPVQFITASVTPKQGTLREIFSITDYDNLSLDRYAKLFSLMDPRQASGSDPNPFVGFLNLQPSPAALRLVDLMSVRYIAVLPGTAQFHKAFAEPGPQWRVAFRTTARHYMVYENPNVLPRAYVAYQWRVVHSEEEALNAITDGAFDPRRTVVLEPNSSVSAVQPRTAGAEITEAAITEYQPTHVQVEADSSSDGYLILTDTFYPGWISTVDGHPTEIVRANYLFRAVPLPRGHHVVRFVYDPLSFKAGEAVTLTALGCIALWVGLALAKRGHDPSGSRRLRD